MIRNLIFDWSGTLGNDESLTLAVTNDVLNAYGAESIDLETYKREFAIPVENFYHPHTGPVPREELDDLFFKRFKQRQLETELFPNAKFLLELLKFRGLHCAILSTMDQTILDQLVQHQQISHLFESVVGNAADKPPILKQLIESKGWNADETLYIGDTPHDIEAAHFAECRAGAAGYGYSGTARLEAERPDVCFDNIADIIKYIDRDHLIATEKKVIATVGGLILNEQNEMLLVKTRKWSDKYGLPGGKIDYGETMEHAYYREIREETGLELDNAEWLVAQDSIESTEFHKPRHFILINYVSRIKGASELQKNYESSTIGWHSYPQAIALNLNKPTREAIHMAYEKGYLTDMKKENL
ncbi:MAG: HAD hydrolase-like protein [Pseudomonadales bacterium]|nr:HAD hydrolase-like protein [Pseudomonadales bacterium]